MSCRNLVAGTAAWLFAALAFQGLAQAQSNVLFIFDASGSMKRAVGDGETRMSLAKQAMSETLAGIPPEVRLGLILYGHRRAKDCTDLELVSPMGADDKESIARTIQAVEARGETPIAESLRQAIRSFAALKGQANRIVLVTDGVEECGGDPCAAAQAVVDAGLDLKVDVVGFTLSSDQRQTVQCVAELTGGSYHDAQDVSGLTTALAEVRREVAEAAPPAVEAPPVVEAPPTRIDLISPENGGGILVAPNDVWLATADDKEDDAVWMRDGEEGVYGFRDERPATFDTFTVLVKGAGGNPKEIALFAGDDGPTGEFRPVATCTFLNAKLIRTPYQECRFPPVTARYVKAQILSSHGDSYVVATEWQILGQLEAADAAGPVVAEKPAASPPIAAINLISPANGGGILVAPNDVWLATADDKEEDAVWMRDGEEGVYGFRDDRPATFDTFAVLVNGAGGNPKEIEISAGDDGPTGEFRSVATCTFQNTKLVRTPYQQCRFPPVTARYVKAKILSSHGDSYVLATEWQVLGQLEP